MAEVSDDDAACTALRAIIGHCQQQRSAAQPGSVAWHRYRQAAVAATRALEYLSGSRDGQIQSAPSGGQTNQEPPTTDL
jgi:hypothetical protein